MPTRPLATALIVLFLATSPAPGAPQSVSPAPASPAGTRPRKATATSQKKARKRKAAPPVVVPPRVRQVTQAFVASADLKPMAIQLLDSRTSAAYAGVEAYAVKHQEIGRAHV